MAEQFIGILKASPEILVFLSLALGYLVGKIKIRGFGIGTTASVLLVAMVLGQFGIGVPSVLKSISFSLFAFSIGYQVGPQFFGALRKEGINYLIISLVVVLAGLGLAILLGKILHFDQGTTAGLFAGAMTQSAVIGTADGAVDQLAIAVADKQVLYNNIAVAYAITYLFGIVGVIVFFKLLPRFLRVDLKAEARRLEEQMGGGSDLKDPELFSWSGQVGLRAYEAARPGIAGTTVREVEALFPLRIAVYEIKREGASIEAMPDTLIKAHDILVLAGKCAGLVHGPEIIGNEVDVASLVDFIGESMDVRVLSPEVVGKTLGELGRRQEAHGLFITQITRQGHKLPILPETVVGKCDMLRIVGSRKEVERAVLMLGYGERSTPVTDLVMVGAGCVLGTLIGMIVIPAGNLPLTLGTGGGVLVAGLVCGWLRSVRPTFGRISDGGQWLLNDLGLSLFVSCVGLTSGKAALDALQTSGLSIFGAGVVLSIVPIIAGALFGKYVLRMNPVLLLGGLTGARVIPQAMIALEEDAESTTVALGFAAPFAFANVFLTIMGSVIVNVM